MKHAGVLLGCVAMAVEAVSLDCALRDASSSRIVASLFFHVCAAFVAVFAARQCGVRGLREYDAVFITAILVPLFGPALAWMMPVESNEEADASREMLEQVERRLDHEEDYARPFYRGDFEADLARQVNSVSYKEVLQTGDLEQKRDAIRKLARLGEPRHMMMVARLLDDDDSELRLCAYLELDRVRQAHERVIGDLIESLRADHIHPVREIALRAELADANLEYAISGTLDETMRVFRVDRCLEQCDLALALDPHHTRSIVIKARGLCERAELEEAECLLANLPDEIWSHPSIRGLRARIRFEMRDFKAAKEIGFEMLRQFMDPPRWLHALCAEHEVDTAHSCRLPRSEEIDFLASLEDGSRVGSKGNEFVTSEEVVDASV
ncbi:MAG: HEAT repeat domain-containing protein [Planctomycetes bacterium]|nr:HEAT repeat domain-containing protein [Planctomycetota bacterium]